MLSQGVGGNPSNDIKESSMTVDYDLITPVLVKALKGQQAIIENLTKRLDHQEKKYAKLQTEIDKYKV